MTERETIYRQTEAIHYSLLSDLATDPTEVSLDKGDKVYFSEGKLAECLLFNPEEFENEFFVSHTALPSEDIQEVVKNYMVEFPKQNLDAKKEALFYHINNVGYAKKSKWLKDTKIKKVIEEGTPYLKVLQESAGRTIIDNKLYTKYKTFIPFIKTSLFYMELFKKEYEIRTTVPIYFEYEGELCKVLIDILLIDHKNKRVIPVDLKTVKGKKEDEFESNYWNYHYYLQGSFYSFGLAHHPLVTDNGYSIAPFTFFVLRKNKLTSPVTFEMSLEDLKVGELGGKSRMNPNYEIKGYKQLIEEYKWHRETTIWNYKKDTFLNKKRILNKFIP